MQQFRAQDKKECPLGDWTDHISPIACCFMVLLLQKKPQAHATRQGLLEVLHLSKAVTGHQALAAKSMY